MVAKTLGSKIVKNLTKNIIGKRSVSGYNGTKIEETASPKMKQNKNWETAWRNQKVPKCNGTKSGKGAYRDTTKQH